MASLAITADSAQRDVRIRALGIVFAAAAFFGTMAVLVRVACRELPSGQVTFFRFAGSLVVLLAFRRGRSLRPSSGKAGQVLLRGLLGACSISLYFRGIGQVGAGLATLLYSVYPVWTAFIARRLVGEQLDGRLGVALVLSAAGLVAVLGPGIDLQHAALPGGIAAAVAALFAGAAVAAARQLRLTESTFLVTTHFMAVGTVATAPTLLAGVGPVTPTTLLVLAGVVLTSLGGQILLHEGLGFMPAAEASLAATTSLVVATGLQALWLGEHLAPEALLGGILIVAAVAVAASRRQPVRP